VIAAASGLNYMSSMDTIRIAERLSEGGVFSEDQAKRLATTLADHLKDELATKHDVALLRRDLEVLQTELTASFDTRLAQGISTIDTKFAQGTSALETRLAQRLSALDTKLAQGVASVETKFDRRMSAMRNQLLASQVGFFIAIILYITLRL
jgi:hypothetical protein